MSLTDKQDLVRRVQETKPARQEVSREEVEAYREVVNDFAEALAIIQDYQRVVKMLCSPDPNILRARSLLQKYKREHLETHPAFKILLDGRDITNYPEIEATAQDISPEQAEYERCIERGTHNEKHGYCVECGHDRSDFPDYVCR